jgi:hypothetical protein
MTDWLDEIRERERKADPGPWKLMVNRGGLEVWDAKGHAIAGSNAESGIFIAHAREDVTKLREALEYYAKECSHEPCDCLIARKALGRET